MSLGSLESILIRSQYMSQMNKQEKDAWDKAVKQFETCLGYRCYGAKPRFANGWKPWTKTMKVKFCCKKCNNQWTTTKGAIDIYLFRNTQEFYLDPLSKQACQSCDRFCLPKLYDEEVERVCESMLNPPQHGERAQMESNMTDNHDSERCERCQRGICNVQRRQEIVLERPVVREQVHFPVNQYIVNRNDQMEQRTVREPERIQRNVVGDEVTQEVKDGAVDCKGPAELIVGFLGLVGNFLFRK